MARDEMDERLDEEVQFHIDMQTERNIRMGMKAERLGERALVIERGAHLVL